MAEMEYTIEDIEEVNGSLVVTVDHDLWNIKIWVFS
jgi:hypothetical protein